MKPTGPTNPTTLRIMSALRKHAKKESAEIWKDIAVRIGKSTRMRPVVNTEKIEKYCNDGDIVVVPGKLLGQGSVSKKITVSALFASSDAKKKIEGAGGKYLGLLDAAKKYPKGSKVKIMA